MFLIVNNSLILETRVEFIICSIAVLTDVVALPINSN